MANLKYGYVPFYNSLLGLELYKGKKANTNHVLIYGLIMQYHSYGDNGCYASNQHIAETLNLTESAVASIVSQLKASGWVDTANDKKNNRRVIMPTKVVEIGNKSSIPAEQQLMLREATADASGSNSLTVPENRVNNKYKNKSIKIEGKPSIKKVEGNYDDKDVEVVEILRAMVSENFPYIKDKPPRRDDYEAINKLHRLDGHSYEDIILMIKWVQQDDFWKQNIRSATKLRIKFDELQIRGRAWFAKKQKARIVEV